MIRLKILFFCASFSFVLVACNSASSTSVSNFENTLQDEGIAVASSSSLAMSSSALPISSSDKISQMQNPVYFGEAPSGTEDLSSSDASPDFISSSSLVLVSASSENESSILHMLKAANSLKNFDSDEIKEMSFDAKKSEMYVKNFVCEERDGNLEWSPDGGDLVIYEYSYDESLNKFSFKDSKDGVVLNFTFEGTFPNGTYIGDSLVEGGYPTMFVENGIALKGGIYESDCPARIFEEDDGNGLNELIDEIGCDYIVLLGIKMGITSWDAEHYVTYYSYGDVKCEEVVRYRFAYLESDCRAAYAEYKNDASAEESFSFEEYDVEESNPECFESVMRAVVADMPKNDISQSASTRNRPVFANNVNKIKQIEKVLKRSVFGSFKVKDLK